MTKKEKELIKEIVNYITPYYPIGEEKYVKLEVIQYLQKLAKEALKNG